MLKSLWGYIEFGISEKGNPRSRTFGRTQDLRPRIHLIGESRYPRPGAVYPSHGLEPRPVTIKVGLNILSIYGTQDPRAGTLNMNDSGALCVYVYFACLSCILRQEHFESFIILTNYSFLVAEKSSTMQLLWNLLIFDKKQKVVIIFRSHIKSSEKRFKSMERIKSSETYLKIATLKIWWICFK